MGLDEEALLLDAREARLAEREMALLLLEAELRGRELASQRRPDNSEPAPAQDPQKAQILRERTALLSLREQVFARRRLVAENRDAGLKARERPQALPGEALQRPTEERRHNDTITMPVSESDALDADALVPRALQRTRTHATPAPTLAGPPPRHNDPTQALPLPDRVPEHPPRPRQGGPTAPFMAALSFGDLQLQRSQLEIDRPHAAVRLLLDGPLPAVEGGKTLRYRSRDGQEVSFEVALRHVVARPPSGTVVVLDASAWSDDAFATFQRAVELLP